MLQSDIDKLAAFLENVRNNLHRPITMINNLDVEYIRDMINRYWNVDTLLQEYTPPSKVLEEKVYLPLSNEIMERCLCIDEQNALRAANLPLMY